MFSLKQQRKKLGLNKSGGFTIVELLIVIVVIGILATLVIVTFTGIQKKARDSQRQTDIQALQSQLEAYYTNVGSYPTAGLINDPAWRAKNLKGLDADALKDPKATTNDIGTGAGSATQYGYAATVSAAGACTVSGATVDQIADCDTYTLTATLEGSTTPYTKKSN